MIESDTGAGCWDETGVVVAWKAVARGEKEEPHECLMVLSAGSTFELVEFM